MQAKTAFILVAFCFLLAAGVPITAQDVAEDRVLDEIVAKINDEIITKTDLDDELRLLKVGLRDNFDDDARLEAAFAEQSRGLLRTLIQNKVIVQRAEELGFDCTEDVEGYIQNQMEAIGVPNIDVLDQVLQQRGTNISEYRRTLCSQITVQFLVQQMVYSRLAVLDEEVADYYESHQADFTEPAKVRVSEILFLKEGNDPDEVRDRAEAALSKIQSGTPFEQVAQDSSEAPTASMGGDMGTFSKGTLSEALEKVVFSLEAGDVSDIIELDYGLQIVKVTERAASVVKPVEEVEREIEARIYQEKAQPELRGFMQDLLQQSYIFVSPRYKDQFDVADLSKGFGTG